MLTSLHDVAQAIETEPQFAGWRVGAQGEGWLELSRGPMYVVLAGPAQWRDIRRREVHMRRARSGNYSLILCGADADFDAARVERWFAPGLTAVVLPSSMSRLALTLNHTAQYCKLRLDAAVLELELSIAEYEIDLLISVGRALSRERDVDSLLDQILRRAREVTGADAGSVYVVEGLDKPSEDRRVKFVASQNDSVGVPSPGFSMEVSESSIVGRCVVKKQVFKIEDLYRLDPPGEGNNPWGFVHDRTFDMAHGYQTRSVLTVPMISARQQVIGVIQLINKRARGWTRLVEPAHFEDGVVEFDEVSESYASALASQAGIALENARLYEEVRTLFEGFVKASVTAIEYRDPTTSGHSERVARLTCGLADATERADAGVYKDWTLRRDQRKQIEYAALLHDFGKVGVREHVLVKAKKLYAHQRDIIIERFQFIRKTLETEVLERKVAYLVDASRQQAAQRLAASGADALAAMEAQMADQLAEVDDFVRFILAANEPTVLEQGGFERVADIAARRYFDTGGVERPYLTDDEANALQILRGSLTPEERAEIESHVVHTYNFLQQIPWGKSFRGIPRIAGAHHEKLDGTGYPKGLAGEDIPVPARMMTISDIYDALTASDRPYKRAVPVPRALDILNDEVKRGKLDADLFRLFIDAKVYEVVIDA